MDILYETSKDTFTGSVSGVGNIENSDKKLYPTHHVAVSPNGRQVATFNSGIYFFFLEFYFILFYLEFNYFHNQL